MNNKPTPVIWISQVRCPIKPRAEAVPFVDKIVLGACTGPSMAKPNRATREAIQYAAEILVEGLFQGFHSFPFRPVAVPLGSDAYRPAVIFRLPVSRLVMQRTLSAAKGARLVQVIGGRRPSDGYSGVVSTVKPLGRLLEWLQASEPEWRQLATVPKDQLILISNKPNDEPRRFVADNEGRHIAAMRRSLDLINKFLSRQCIALEITDEALRTKPLTGQDRSEHEEEVGVNFFRAQLYRVFAHGALQKGGRIYGGWWQGLRREFRPRILINGFRTVELDFDSLSIHMLYAQEGIMPPPGDKYDLGFRFAGKDDPRRDIVKKFVNASINDQKGTYRIQREHLNELGVSMQRVREMLAAKHPQIAHHFGSGIGVELQALDAQIAERVLLDMLALGEVCLPIHDSFIVRAQAEHALEASMKSAYLAVMKQQVTASRKAGSAGPTINRPSNRVLDSICPGATIHDLMAALKAHFGEYKFLSGWTSSWEAQAYPITAGLADEPPVNHRLLKHRLQRRGNASGR